MKKILIILFLMLAQPVYAQSVDSLWGLRTLRNFTDSHTRIIGATLVGVALLAQGANNSYLYNRDNALFSNLHSIQDVQTYSVSALGYVAGLDAMQAAGLNLMVNVGFKCQINLGMYRPCIDPNEERYYESFGWERKMFFRGNRRYLQLGIGGAMLAYRPIIRKIKRVLK